MSIVKVRPARPEDQAAWDAFVHGHPNGSFFHLFGWQDVITQAARLRCPYLLAEAEGCITGVLPLTFLDSWLFGRKLVSTAFCVEGGPLVTRDDALLALDNEAQSLSRELGASSLTYRLRQTPFTDRYVDTETYAGFRRPIASDAEAILSSVPRKQRAVIRKALNNNMRIDTDADVDLVYDLYAKSVRALGTPVFPRALFRQLKEVFAQECEALVVYSAAGQPVASLMSFFHGDTVLPYYAGGETAARQLGAHDLMYYDLMCRAVARGISIFDFGRSRTGSGPYRFKRNWGFEPEPFAYATLPVAGGKVPPATPDNGVFGMLSGIWRHLPLSVTNKLGPLVSRYLG